MTFQAMPVAHAERGLVILGVAESDAHAVANQLIAYHLRSHGFAVLNLGACTSIGEFADTCGQHPEALAVVIGTTNGHALEDLQALRQAKDRLEISCPVILGGKLWIGSNKPIDIEERLAALGVNYIIDRPSDLVRLLESLPPRNRAAPRRAVATSVISSGIHQLRESNNG
jgi:methylaspartate mutase sigma subunit